MYRDISLYILDIFIASNKISRYTENFTNAQDFLNSEINWDASIRELEIIGEASKILINTNTISSEYRRIVDFRNQISHAYFGIDEDIVWDVIQHKLPAFLDYLIILCKTINIKNAIQFAKEENINNAKLIDFLINLDKKLYG
ncbi:DUF86 domain-containing protein [Arcobacter sp. FWKO B]|uniref:HepT-like ribonuclease domain-containing protein n=1 Tax=Arcobacter sp. FWKO B TaxID=2593672 RepID=UPI0018A50E67|nr:HepT-like ribonuclease domain-containing protein [Arcobacter sp. FWKO B]QOG12501.1 DUF86 domain-containing protein [Arcobacter sp. FWKO B]